MCVYTCTCVCVCVCVCACIGIHIRPCRAGKEDGWYELHTIDDEVCVHGIHVHVCVCMRA